MNNKPLVSIITPNKNYGRFLPNVISDALKQTFTDWELIIVDYGSTDNSLEILRQHQQNPKIKIFERDSSHYNEAINFGITQAAGKYIIRHDADDLWENKILEKLIKEIKKNTSIGLVFCDAVIIDENDNILHPSFIKYHHHLVDLEASNKILQGLIERNFIPTSGTLFKKIYGK